MKNILTLFAACLIGQAAHAQPVCNLLTKGGFENGCGTYAAHCSDVGDTEWTYFAPSLAPSLILNTSTGQGCIPCQGCSPYPYPPLGIGVGNNPPTWNGSPFNKHYITLRKGASELQPEERGVYTELSNSLVNGQNYIFRARYNYYSTIGTTNARISLRVIASGDLGCGNAENWATVAVESFTISNADYQDEWLTIEGIYQANATDVVGVAVVTEYLSGSSSSRINVDAVEFYAMPSCPGDFNGDGVINTGDLIQFWANYALFTDSDSCLLGFDLNSDGVINTGDLNAILGQFGTNCPPEFEEKSLLKSDDALGLVAYPTLVQEYLTVSSVPAGTQWLDVVDTRGSVVATERWIGGGSQVLSTTALTAGMYLIRARTEQGTAEQLRFVKTR